MLPPPLAPPAPSRLPSGDLFVSSFFSFLAAALASASRRRLASRLASARASACAAAVPSRPAVPSSTRRSTGSPGPESMAERLLPLGPEEPSGAPEHSAPGAALFTAQSREEIPLRGPDGVDALGRLGSGRSGVMKWPGTASPDGTGAGTSTGTGMAPTLPSGGLLLVTRSPTLADAGLLPALATRFLASRRRPSRLRRFCCATCRGTGARSGTAPQPP